MTTPCRITAARALAASVNRAEALALLEASPLFANAVPGDAAAMLQALEVAGAEYATTPRSAFWPSASGASPPVDGLNRDYFVLPDGGQTTVGHFVEHVGEEGQIRRRLETMSMTAFSQLFEHRSASRNETVGDAWRRWIGRRQYAKLVFDPEHVHPESTLNLWTGWARKPKTGDWSLLRAHIEKVVCGGDQASTEYLLNWLAFIVQKPGKMTGVATVLRGGQGTGKSFLGRIIRSIAGQHGMLVSQANQVVGTFNAQLRDLLFLEASEAFFAGDRSMDGKLKALITDSSIAIEAKGRDIVSVPNRLNILMTSNSDWVVPASADSRRYFVLDVENAQASQASYFEPLARERDHGGVEAFMFDLLARDLSAFKPSAFPRTGALKAQREQSLCGAPAFLLHLAAQLAEGTIPTRDWMGTTELHGAYLDWTARHRHEHPLHVVPFARALTKAGLQGHRTGRANGWRIPPPEELTATVRAKAGLAPVEPEEAAAPSLAIQPESTNLFASMFPNSTITTKELLQ